jgi:hypothetical protein
MDRQRTFAALRRAAERQDAQRRRKLGRVAEAFRTRDESAERSKSRWRLPIPVRRD